MKLQFLSTAVIFGLLTGGASVAAPSEESATTEFLAPSERAAAPVVAVSTGQSGSTAGSISAETQNSQEVIALRAQLLEAQRFQEQVLSTVYWALSTLGGVAVLLVGFGWWTNFRVYERDKQSIERELRTVLLEAVRQSKEEQQALSEKHFSELRQQLNVGAASSEARLSAQLKLLIETSEKQLSTQVSQLKLLSAALQKELRELQLAAEIQERLNERKKNNYRNALQSAVSALELANNLGDEYSVGDVLDLVSEDIATILRGNDLPIDNFLIGQLVEALNVVKGSHAHAAAALKSKASKLVAA